MHPAAKVEQVHLNAGKINAATAESATENTSRPFGSFLFSVYFPA